MRIKPEYFISYDEDEICVMRREPDGSAREVSPLTLSAAMAWEGIEHGASRETIIDAVANEFDGADRDAVARDLDALIAQLIALGYAEE